MTKKKKKVTKTKKKRASNNTFIKGLERRLIGTAIILDEEGNVLLGKEKGVPNAGNPHYTLSERLAEMRDNGSQFACVACKILTWIGRYIFGSKARDHCKYAMTGMPRWEPTDG